MKNKIFFLFAIIYIHSYSQQKPTNGLVLYELTVNNVDMQLIKEYQMFFDNKISFYEEVVDPQLKKSKEYKEDGTISLNIRDNKTPNFYYNLSKNEFYFGEIHYNDHLFVREDETI